MSFFKPFSSKVADAAKTSSPVLQKDTNSQNEHVYDDDFEDYHDDFEEYVDEDEPSQQKNDFVHSKLKFTLRDKKRQAYNRYKALKEAIALDTFDSILLELSPVPAYSSYLNLLNAGKLVESSVNDHDGSSLASIQTDPPSFIDSWTQCPVSLQGDSATVSNNPVKSVKKIIHFSQETLLNVTEFLEESKSKEEEEQQHKKSSQFSADSTAFSLSFAKIMTQSNFSEFKYQRLDQMIPLQSLSSVEDEIHHILITFLIDDQSQEYIALLTIIDPQKRQIEYRKKLSYYGRINTASLKIVKRKTQDSTLYLIAGTDAANVLAWMLPCSNLEQFTGSDSSDVEEIFPSLSFDQRYPFHHGHKFPIIGLNIESDISVKDTKQNIDLKIETIDTSGTQIVWILKEKQNIWDLYLVERIDCYYGQMNGNPDPLVEAQPFFYEDMLIGWICRTDVHQVFLIQKKATPNFQNHKLRLFSGNRMKFFQIDSSYLSANNEFVIGLCDDGMGYFVSRYHHGKLSAFRSYEKITDEQILPIDHFCCLYPEESTIDTGNNEIPNLLVANRQKGHIGLWSIKERWVCSMMDQIDTSESIISSFIPISKKSFLAHFKNQRNDSNDDHLILYALDL